MGRIKSIAGLAAVVFAILVLTACGESQTAGNAGTSDAESTSETAVSAEDPAGKSVEAWYTSAQVRQGRAIYNNNCANCHGAMAQGARNWRQRGPDGNFPAPPLNGSGHTWHHPMPVLEQIIREGGPANMPAWGRKLSDAEITSVLAYVQSLWPEKVYNAWAERMQRSGQQG